MTWRAMTVMMLLLGVSPARAMLTSPVADVPSDLCRPAIKAAERAHGIPSHLLLAIGRIESGRRDTVSGAFNPWPWTVNADGQGYFYDTKPQAVAAVQAMQQRGTRSIDVGCMQISLLHHPDAFPSLDRAFDPAANADYGGRFLSELHDKANSWPKAVEYYHSATPEIGAEYGRAVYAILPEEQRLADLGPSSPLATALSATMTPSPFTATFRPSPARVILLPSIAPAGGAPGRGLDSYRASPIRLASSRG